MSLFDFFLRKPAEPSADFLVSVDHVTHRFVSGWILQKDTSQSVSFDLRVNGKTVAHEVCADIFRFDLADHFGGHGNHGYHVELDPKITTPTAVIEFLIPGTRTQIAKVEKPIHKHIGHIEHLDARSLSGWVCSPDTPGRVEIDVYAGETPLQRKVIADLTRQDLSTSGTENFLGFSIKFPKQFEILPESVFQIFEHRTGAKISERSAADLLPENYFDKETPQLDDGAEKERREQQLQRHHTLIQHLFDRHFYHQAYGLDETVDPARHYLETGWEQGFDPTPWFSTRYYLRANPDVLENGINPFVHYVKSGDKEARAPAQDAETTSYLDAPWFDDIRALVLTECLVQHGTLQIEGYAHHPYFPGLPLRLDIALDDRAPIRVLARGNKPFSSNQVPFELDKHLAFHCRLDLPQETESLLLRIGIPETDISTEIELSPVENKTYDIVYPAPKLDWKVVGSVDGVSSGRITGWALYEESPNTSLTLILSIGGKPVASTVCRVLRADLRTKIGGDGYAGFVFDIPPEVSAQQEYTNYAIKPMIGENKIRRKFGYVPRSGLISFDATQDIRRDAVPVAAVIEDEPVSIIVLNLNGASILGDLLQSAFEREDNEKIDWIIIDHGSVDSSEEIAQAAADRGQRVRFISRSGNQSFSASNNYGARLAEHDTLIFANNDLIFRAPFRIKILEALAAPDVGAVGALLYDYYPEQTAGKEAPVQHTGVCFSRKVEGKWLRPFELRPIPGQFHEIGSVIDVPVVTGAFVAIHRADFEAIGGFSEDYIYGLEDVDFCLKVKSDLDKKVVCDMRLDIVHHRGFSRLAEKNVTIRQRNNNNCFNKNWALFLRNAVRQDLFSRPSYWCGATPVVAFIVADAGDNTAAGEYFTALELGKSLQKIFPCQIRFLTEPEWTNLEGIDVLIAMVAHFDIQKAKQVNPYLITINWTRQWFDRWAESDTLYKYDIVFASSQRAADYLIEKTGLDVAVLPIATDFGAFENGTAQEKFQADYCFTGNFVGTNREIMYQLEPDQIKASGAVYGSGWSGMPFESIWRGPISYSQIPDIYASSKIAIDDANIATKDWGSCNSRVFDAIAGGCLLISNGAKGVTELFGDAVPTFDSAETLRETIDYWTEHEEERLERVQQLQEIVRNNHTYDHRAKIVAKHLSKNGLKPRIAIKCAAIWAERDSWGDYHFACALAAELRKLGLTVRVDCREDWNCGLAVADDVNIVLRGLVPFSPPAHQLNIMWLISHPADVPAGELNKYDHVYTASEYHSLKLSEELDVPVETLLQCTDGNRFHYNVVDKTERGRSEALFVGNSRGIFRHAVQWAIEAEQDIDLYGKGWEQFVKDHRFKGHHISNVVLPEFYARSRVVLCDHWKDMSQYGYLSNRAFDVLACGSWLAVDEVVGLEDILPGGYSPFRTKEELRDVLNTKRFGTQAERKKLAAWVANHHTFRNRAETIATLIRTLLPHHSELRGTGTE